MVALATGKLQGMQAFVAGTNPHPHPYPGPNPDPKARTLTLAGPSQAFMAGKMKVKGNMMLAQKFGALAGPGAKSKL
jgi:putative sterol carrier protein